MRALMKITVTILSPYLNWRKKSIELKENSTVHDLITKLHTHYGVPKKKYDKRLRKRVHFFWGELMLKNGRVIGFFDEDDFRTTSNDKILKDGDDVAILFPVAGG